MKVAVIGSGAVGAYFGAKLANAGFKVSFLARGKQLEAIKSSGIKVKSILGDFDVNTPPVADRISLLGKSDLIMVGVKAWQIKEVRDEIGTIVHEESMVLPLQNGVLAVEELTDALDAKLILGGISRIISKVEAPGVINHFGATPSIVFGELDKTKTARVEKLKSVFDKAGIESRISNDIDIDIWKKFGFICVGGLMAATRSNLGTIRNLPETREMIVNIVKEICLLAENLGINMGADFASRTLSFIDNLPEKTTFSMARDIWEGRPSELDYLNGAVVQLSQRHQIDTPLNRILYNILKPMELEARSK